MYPWNEASGVTRFEDTLRERGQGAAYDIAVTPAERDAIVAAIQALRYLTPFTAYKPAQDALDALDAGSSAGVSE
jgi:hypothetical protein